MSSGDGGEADDVVMLDGHRIASTKKEGYAGIPWSFVGSPEGQLYSVVGDSPARPLIFLEKLK